MRLFAAIDLPADVRASLAAAMPDDDRLRFVPSHQWHVTLAFYGEVAEPVVPQLQERLARAAARTPRLRLALGGASSFPPAPRPGRVLWCGISGDVALLSRLADRAVAAGRRCRIEMDPRPFRPHLTLARARGAPFDLTAAIETLSGYKSPEWSSDELRLVHSDLGPPVSHELLALWPLRPVE